MTRCALPPSHSRPVSRPPAAAARRRLAATVACEVGLLALLARGAGAVPVAVPGALRSLPDRFAAAPPLDAVATVAHLLALALTAWLTAVTVGHLLIAVSRRPRAQRVSDRLTPIAVRRVVAAAVVTAGTVASVPCSPAGAGPRSGAGTGVGSGHPPVVTVRNGRATPVATDPVVPVASVAPGTPVTPGTPIVRVAQGDSLWTLTRDAVATETGRDAHAVGSAEIAPRWVLVCDANRGRLRSGDVNILAPGEEVVIPPG